MNAATNVSPSKMSSVQVAYDAARARVEASKLAAEALKRARRIDYTSADTDEAIDAMAEREGECDREAGVLVAERALKAAEQDLVEWGIGVACAMRPALAATFRDLQARAASHVIARNKLVDLCARLAV